MQLSAQKSQCHTGTALPHFPSPEHGPSNTCPVRSWSGSLLICATGSKIQTNVISHLVRLRCPAAKSRCRGAGARWGPKNGGNGQRWMERVGGKESLHFPFSFGESANVMDGNADGRSLCEIPRAEWPDLDRMHRHGDYPSSYYTPSSRVHTCARRHYSLSQE